MNVFDDFDNCFIYLAGMRVMSSFFTNTLTKKGDFELLFNARPGNFNPLTTEFKWAWLKFV